MIDSNPEAFDPSHLPPHVLTALEADSFWCLSRLLDGIQDNYISGQPGIMRSVGMLGELVGRIDRAFFLHITSIMGILNQSSRSATGCSPKSPARRVHAVRFQMDELPAHAGT